MKMPRSWHWYFQGLSQDILLYLQWRTLCLLKINKVFSFGQNIIVKHLYTVVSYTPAVVDIIPSGIATIYTTVN